MTKKLCKIWVDPDFKRMVKTKAAEKDLSIIDYTRFLANDEEKYDIKEKKKLKFFF